MAKRKKNLAAEILSRPRRKPANAWYDKLSESAKVTVEEIKDAIHSGGTTRTVSEIAEDVKEAFPEINVTAKQIAQYLYKR